MSKIQKLHNGCWVNPNIDDATRYWGIWDNAVKQQRRAHIASYELFIGPIPRGLYVLHKCDNDKCVNPEHLFVGTQQDNMRDMIDKGRHPDRTGQIQSKGFHHHSAKLSKEDVAEVLRRLEAGEPQLYIAIDFSVSQATISNISRGFTSYKEALLGD